MSIVPNMNCCCGGPLAFPALAMTFFSSAFPPCAPARGCGTPLFGVCPFPLIPLDRHARYRRPRARRGFVSIERRLEFGAVDRVRDLVPVSLRARAPESTSADDAPRTIERVAVEGDAGASS